MGADQPTHAVEATDTLPAGVELLRVHRAYLDGLGRDFDSDTLLPWPPPTRSAFGVPHGVVFGRIKLQGTEPALTTTWAPGKHDRQTVSPKLLAVATCQERCRHVSTCDVHIARMARHVQSRFISRLAWPGSM